MFDQLMQLVKQHAGDAIINNNAIPDVHNNAAIQDVTDQIFSGLKNQVTQGNFQQVISMFQGNSNSIGSHPMTTQLISSIAVSLASKFGVSQQAAQNMASTLVPSVMQKLVHKTNDPTDTDFDLQSILSNFSGNSNFDIGSILGQVTGNNQQGGLGGLGNVLGKLFG